MAAYVRVELHEIAGGVRPTAATYDRLHSDLQAKGIERWVDVEGVGNQYLPSGFYYCKGSDKSAIGNDVQSAARSTGFPFSYVVVVSGGALVHNLKHYSTAQLPR